MTQRCCVLVIWTCPSSKTRLSDYLDIEGDHPLFEQIDGLLEKLEVTPVVVAEQLMRIEDPELALEALLDL